MAKVYLLCGKIASGKTFYAKKMQENQTAVILSVDDLMLNLFDGCLGEKHNETVAKIFNYFYGLAREMIAKEISVIFDSGFWTKAEREQVKKHFADQGIQTELHYVKVPEERRLRQLDRRNKSLQGSPSRQYIIGRELLARLDSRFEEPDADEIDVLAEL